MLINSRKRRKYINDYKINDEGKYQYYGTCYRWMEPDNRKRVLHGFWAAQLSALAGTIVCGLIPAPGVNYVPVLLIPYMAGIVLSIMSVFALYNLSDEPDPVRDHVFNATVRRLPVLEMLNIITGLLCTAGEIYYLIAYGPEEDIAFGILFQVFTQSVLNGFFEFLYSFTTYIAYTDFGRLGFFATLFCKLFTTFFSEHWNGQTDNFAVILRSDTYFRIHNGFLNQLEHRLVPGFNGNGTGIRSCNGRHIVKRDHSAIRVHTDVVQDMHIGFSCTDMRQFVIKIHGSHLHFLFALVQTILNIKHSYSVFVSVFKLCTKEQFKCHHTPCQEQQCP